MTNHGDAALSKHLPNSTYVKGPRWGGGEQTKATMAHPVPAPAPRGAEGS